MTKTEFLSVRLSRQEKWWGLGYLLFQVLFLPTLLNMLFLVLPIDLDGTRINFIYLSINLLAVTLIFHRYILSFFPVSRKGLLRSLAVGTACFALYWVLSLVLGNLLGLLDPEFANQNDQAISGMIEVNYPMMFVSTVILAPITEECFFRGLLFRGLYDRAPIAAWIVSVSAFSAIHLLGYLGSLSPLALTISFLQYLPAGLCLAASYYLSGSLICPVLIHAAINAIGMVVVR